MSNTLQPAYAGYDTDAQAAWPHAHRPAAPGIVIGRRTVLVWSAIVVGLLTWSAASTSYILFRDQILQDIRQHHAAAERLASTQAAVLRTEIDHLKSSRMADQAALGEQVDELLKREAALERRQEALGDLANAVAGPPGAPADLSTKPHPVDDTVRLEAPGRPPQESRALPINLPGLKLPSGLPHGAQIASLADGYDSVEAGQAAALGHLEEKLDHQRDTLAAVYTRLGVAAPSADVDVGGPYIPIQATALGGDGSFARALGRVSIAKSDLARLRQGLVHLPVRSPLPSSELEETSPFGSRYDPFYHTLAFHPGLDLRAAYGTAVHATAAGKVVIAGWTGGYGNMVEISHGDGVATRYGHLSAIEVHPGEAVEEGQEVGRVGSTGRSTGPHLHYEVRLGDQPVDPTRFLTAGNRLAAVADGSAQD